MADNLLIKSFAASCLLTSEEPGEGTMRTTHAGKAAVAAAAAASAVGLTMLAAHRVPWPAEELTLRLRAVGPPASRPGSSVGRQAAHVRCALQSLAGGVSPDGGACPPVKVVPSAPSGFAPPRFAENGGQTNENGAGWTAAGVLDNSAYAAGSVERWPASEISGKVREINGDAVDAGGSGRPRAGGLGTHCGFVCVPCDVDVRVGLLHE